LIKSRPPARADLKDQIVFMTGTGEISKPRTAQDLFNLVKTGDQKALKELFTIYFPRLNDFARKIVRDEGISEDIVQEAFLKVWEKRGEIESLHIEAFLFKMVRNRCLDYIKHLKVISNRLYEIQETWRYEELYRIDFVGNEPYLLIEQELKTRIERTIQDLPGKCREVFVLSRLNGLKNREIADKLNISIKNVERHLNRATQSFRKNFSGEFPIALVILLLRNL
jgi:RNA polymerase sigma-70 factor, ECF subfamily